MNFHDNADIAKWLIENPQTVGEAIAKGVCKGYGVTYKAPSDPSPKQDVFYRVQVGVYNDRKNAEAFLEQVASSRAGA